MCTALLVTPPLRDLHVAVNDKMMDPLFEPALYFMVRTPVGFLVGLVAALTPVGLLGTFPVGTGAGSGGGPGPNAIDAMTRWFTGGCGCG